MDLTALETKWRTALSSILDELTEVEFQKLLFNLEKIPQGKKEGQPRGNMTSFIIQYYGPRGIHRTHRPPDEDPAQAGQQSAATAKRDQGAEETPEEKQSDEQTN
ncbi:putative metal-dependent hydrolase [Dissostichus eleginoides]|uniref:Metal-dependent hydrolase n=1 Tax=Dissostichus eleginoides TaxID=100907 RepID=A0AAD9EN43_DISEL|nr:putative metal-dependent hydrolase [Dissostichus eleginoides]